ncbi:uncharacterized protein LOC142336742 [Convolutriloba macropyga]|uniref:uncharacterized protein LOC142336742 n=1 Tax=Convolutriloba macropyga TaxID=536237 RepID=UPI003F51BA90
MAYYSSRGLHRKPSFTPSGRGFHRGPPLPTIGRNPTTAAAVVRGRQSDRLMPREHMTQGVSHTEVTKHFTGKSAPVSGYNRDLKEEREQRMQQRKQREEQKLKRIWQDAQRSKQEAKEAKLERKRQNDLRMQEIREQLIEKQKERQRSYSEMIQERKEAEKMTQLELERIRKESEQRRHHGYWLGDRPNFPSNTNTLSSRRATADASASLSSMDRELELLKVGKRSSRYLSLPDGRGGGSRSTSPRFSSPAGSQSSLISKSLVKGKQEKGILSGDEKSPAPSPTNITKRDSRGPSKLPRKTSKRKASSGSTRMRIRRAVSVSLGRSEQERRSRSAPIAFSELAKRLLYAKRRYSAMKLKTAVAKRMRTLALAEQKSPQIAFMPKVDYEKPVFASIDIDNLLDSDMDSSLMLKAKTYREMTDPIEPIRNDFPSPIFGQVSPTDPRIRPADHSTSNELIIDEEDM